MNTDTERRKLRRQRLMVGAAAAAVVFFTGWAVWYGFKREIVEFVWRQSRGTKYEPAVLRWALARIGKPIERDLANGQFGPGTPVNEIVARHPPERTRHLGRYTYLHYFPEFTFGGGPVILLRDGRAVAAATSECVYVLLFYDTLPEAEHAELVALRQADDDRRDAVRRLGPMAVAGFGASIDPWTLPQPATAPE